jgi:hypothetical protein
VRSLDKTRIKERINENSVMEVITSHFGKNPVKGGRPLKEKREIRREY